MKFIVAIDGPAGTGKSSAARQVAKSLAFIYVDTGALYRALAYLISQEGIESDDINNIIKLIPRITIHIDNNKYHTDIYIDNKKVDDELRKEEISKLASVISQHPKIREKLLVVQRNLLSHIKSGAIFEGRDIGTVVFPQATLKIYITASSETRAQRRFLERQQNNISYNDILEAIESRDLRDKSRAHAPMLPADDAVIIDTSDMSLQEVIDKILNLIKKKEDTLC
jgi:cytidylate kinase